MTPELTDTLCTRCGLCCDGTLFADVELAGRSETSRVALMGLEVEEDAADGALLIQPCAALRGRRCGIYAHRPACCRSFECRLLQDARRGTISVEGALATIAEALGHVRRAKVLLARMGHADAGLPLLERCAEAIGAGTPAGLAARRRRAELAGTARLLERVMRRAFLSR